MKNMKTPIIALAAFPGRQAGDRETEGLRDKKFSGNWW